MYSEGAGRGRAPLDVSSCDMAFSNPILPLLLALGTLFGALAAACAYLITYAELQRRFLRPDQNPRQMALKTAAVTFLFFVVAAVVLSFILPLVMKPTGV